MIEKREWRRADVDIEAECCSVSLPQKCFKARVVNMNDDGLCCVIPMAVNIGQRIKMDLDLKAQGRLSLVVKAMWSGHFEKENEYRAGVKIAEISSEDKERYMSFYNLQLIRSAKKK